MPRGRAPSPSLAGRASSEQRPAPDPIDLGGPAPAGPRVDTGAHRLVYDARAASPSLCAPVMKPPSYGPLYDPAYTRGLYTAPSIVRRPPAPHPPPLGATPDGQRRLAEAHAAIERASMDAVRIMGTDPNHDLYACRSRTAQRRVVAACRHLSNVMAAVADMERAALTPLLCHYAGLPPAAPHGAPPGLLPGDQGLGQILQAAPAPSHPLAFSPPTTTEILLDCFTEDFRLPHRDERGSAAQLPPPTTHDGSAQPRGRPAPRLSVSLARRSHAAGLAPPHSLAGSDDDQKDLIITPDGDFEVECDEDAAPAPPGSATVSPLPWRTPSPPYNWRWTTAPASPPPARARPTPLTWPSAARPDLLAPPAAGAGAL